jgi:PAS domain S-box-containing protein
MTALQHEKTILSTLINSITDEIWFADIQGNFTLANPAALKEFDLSSDRAIGVIELANQLEVFRPDGSPRPIEEAPPLQALRGNVVRLQEEIVRPTAHSELRYRQVSAAPVRDSNGRIIGSVSVVRDISDLHRAEARLQKAESRYRLLVENAQEAILVAQDGFLKFVNRTAGEMTGYSEEELLSRPFPEFIHPDDRIMVVDRYLQRLAGEKDNPRYPFRLLTRLGEVKWVEIGTVLIEWDTRPATLNFLTDITARHKTDEANQAAFREKEVMLREIHNRVNNNMQIISSLLNLQAGNLADENSRRILKEGLLRIRSMAIVHEKLYKSPDLSKIDFADYVQSLADHLFHFFQIEAGRIRLEADLEAIELDINSAVPCGLLVNELLSNSLKHAFPVGKEGVLAIRLRRRPDGAVEIRVADNGIGLPEDVNMEQPERIGLQIVTLLIGQLGGTIELARENGTAFTVIFRERELK